LTRVQITAGMGEMIVSYNSLARPMDQISGILLTVRFSSSGSRCQQITASEWNGWP